MKGANGAVRELEKTHPFVTLLAKKCQKEGTTELANLALILISPYKKSSSLGHTDFAARPPTT